MKTESETKNRSNKREKELITIEMSCWNILIEYIQLRSLALVSYGV